MIELLFENNDIAVCIKPIRIVSQSDNGNDLVALLKEQIKSEIYPVHRLDTAVGGVMVFAKTKSSASDISRQIQDGKFKKTYLAVVDGIPDSDGGILEDLLFKDSHKNKSFVVSRERKGVKKASLEYKVIDKAEGKSLLEIQLHTGRTHQIRVQFSSRKLPLTGDGKYGSKDNSCSIALWSENICFSLKNEKYSFTSEPNKEIYPWNLFQIYSK